MSFVLWEILIPLIIAFLLGLLFGWLMWGWRRTKITYTEWETMRQKANRASSVEAEAELVELRADRDRLQLELDECTAASEQTAAATEELGTGVLGLTGAAAVAATAGNDDEDTDTGGDADANEPAAVASDDGDADAAEGEGDPTALADADRPVAGGERHPYGEGSHAPFADDPKAQPAGYDIKGNADSMLYHRTDSRSYKATIAEVWFDTAERAEAAGFGLANSHPKG